MNRNIETRTELLALVRKTKESVIKRQPRMILCSDEIGVLFHSASIQTIDLNTSLPIPKPVTFQAQQTISLKHKENPALEDFIEPFKEKSTSDRLLPRSFDSSVPDTTTIREAMSKIEGMPHLSATPIYSSSSKKPSSQWAIGIYIGAQESSQRATFIESVSKAIRERLSIEAVLLSCEDDSFPQLLPMVIDDCEVVLLFVDHHLEQKLREILRSVPSYNPTPQFVAAPFITFGTLHKKPLRGILLNKDTHEDRTFKQQLWTSLRELTTKVY